MWFLKIQFFEKEWKPTGIFPQCKQKCVFWTFYFSKKSVKSMSISEMCKFVSFNSLSLYMGERENSIRSVYKTYVLSIFVRAPIPTAFSVQPPRYEMLNSPPFYRFSTVQTTIRIRWYMWYRSSLASPFPTQARVSDKLLFYTDRFPLLTHAYPLRPLYDCTRNIHSQ